MADFADISAAREELDRSLALKVRAPEVPIATGQCLSCEKPLPDGVRWCDADCRDDWQLDQRAGRVA